MCEETKSYIETIFLLGCKRDHLNMMIKTKMDDTILINNHPEEY